MHDSTQANLLTLFTRFADSNRRCFAYGRKALDDGCPNTARFFHALTRSYSIQAANMLKRAGAIQSSAENLKQILIEEREMCLDVLPDYISQARAEGDNAPRIAFEWSQGSGESLADLFEEVLRQLVHDHDCDINELHVCAICGYLVKGEAPDVCPNCGVNKKLIPAVE